MKVFQLQKSTVRFFYEADKYWQEHKSDKKDSTIKKLKPLYKGITGYMIRANREVFLFRNLDYLWSYKITKRFISRDDYIYHVLVDGDYFRSFYNVMCDYYFKYLKANDMVKIHETYKGDYFPLLDETYNLCGGN
jgi:hypothetical protein